VRAIFSTPDSSLASAPGRVVFSSCSADPSGIKSGLSAPTAPATATAPCAVRRNALRATGQNATCHSAVRGGGGPGTRCAPKSAKAALLGHIYPAPSLTPHTPVGHSWAMGVTAGRSGASQIQNLPPLGPPIETDAGNVPAVCAVLARSSSAHQQSYALCFVLCAAADPADPADPAPAAFPPPPPPLLQVQLRALDLEVLARIESFTLTLLHVEVLQPRRRLPTRPVRALPPVVSRIHTFEYRGLDSKMPKLLLFHHEYWAPCSVSGGWGSSALSGRDKAEYI
jgi:hypothetical protein